ncbi:hypothetical protein Tco_0090840 [Tanacetum coccineum]
MVAYLEKNEENADFHQILDFLTSGLINFSLTVSPTIYASYIEQFWNTACLKTINLEKQIHADVDGKVVVNQIKGFNTASSLEAEQASGNINKTQFTATLNEPFSLELGSDTNRNKDKAQDPQESSIHIWFSSKRQSFRDGFCQEKDAENQGKIVVDDTEVVKGGGDTKVLDTEKAVNTASKGVSTASVLETVSTAVPRTPPTTTIFDDEDETESVEKIKKKVQGDAQIERDDEVALILQEELDKELKVERERQEEASKVAIAEMFDEVHARMDADYELAARMTQEEQEKYTIEEKARLLAEFFERRKKQLATKRAEAIRNKPPTKTQLRNLMMTYLKNMGGYKHSQLKGKSYEEIQGLYERHQKRIRDFTPMDSDKEDQKSCKRLKRVAGSYAT